MIALIPNVPSDRATRILCVGAHADDIEIGCGGTMLALTEQLRNVAVDWVVFSATPEREREARASADAFLAAAKETTVVVHAFRDGFFPYVGGQIKEEFERLKERCAPDLILTHYRQDLHQDHRMISELTWNTFRKHLILEYEIPKYDGDLGAPSLFVPLAEATCERKIDYLMEHFRSQRERSWFSRGVFTAALRLRGLEASSPTALAEGFYCRKVTLGMEAR
ncbi:MAG TPA: PIG-L deacetylase family protein [Methylomirabilota bacterium]|jgi:LmbE family N-acetylglucosaminyl deacetylase|nr:PIG-L deacetylase family protein [Methylomirabilota bacterium]